MTFLPRMFQVGAFALASLLATGAHAQKAGDWVFGAGALHYAPQDKSSTLRFTQPVEREIPGSGSDLRSTAFLNPSIPVLAAAGLWESPCSTTLAFP